MERKNAINFLKSMRKMMEKHQDLKALVGETEFLLYIIDKQVDILLDCLGIPKDTTVEKDKDWFCRDYWYVTIYDYLARRDDRDAEQILDDLLKPQNKVH